MTLRQNVEAVRDRASKQLDEAHDYFTYTKEIWRILQAETRRKGLTFSLQNIATGSKVSEVDLLDLAPKYMTEELASATLQQFVSIFENFLFDVLRLWLLAYPEFLSKRQLNGREICRLPDKSAIIDALVDKELREIFYDRPANWFQYLNDHVNAGVPTVDQARQFSEVKATRDILVHGQGTANAFYVEKAGSAARAGVGERLDLSEPYHQASWNLISNLVRELGDAMAARAQGG